jgi:glycosyltransferase involved in cell wall biosynthesis
VSAIFLDVSRLLVRKYEKLLPTGVDRVSLAYVEHYAPIARAVISRWGVPVVLTANVSQKVFSLLLSDYLSRSDIRKYLLYGLLSARAESVRPSGGCLLHTSHTGMEYPGYYRFMKARDIHPVFMIHDLIPITHSEYCRPQVDHAHRTRIHTAIRYASGLIGNSQFTLDDLAREASQSGLRLPPTAVARLASGVTINSETCPPLATPYFLMLGTIEPRKNHWFMLHVWRRMIELFGNAAPKLVIVGRRGWECENVIDMLERCDRLRSHVIELSDCSDAELQAWMKHARALLFPSFVEGYGMPLVEALAMKTPVLASHLSVFEEIANDIPDYLDPLDGPGWIERILAFAQPDSPARQAQLSRIERFKEPTWEEHFERVDAFLESLN